MIKNTIYKPLVLDDSWLNSLKSTFEWIEIPTGTFTMGSPLSEAARMNNETQHQVTISAFKMSKYEVTFEQYDLFCEETGRIKPDDKGWGRDKRPVINVNWQNASAFAKSLDCRLPTEAEWEYACRAGTTTPYNIGNCLNTSKANFHGNHQENAGNPVGLCRTRIVGTYPPNAWGLFDMHGNVSEWCSDWCIDWDGDYTKDSLINPIGPSTGKYHVRRGGCWYDTSERCRSACRHNFHHPGHRYDFIGFRLACSK